MAITRGAARKDPPPPILPPNLRPGTGLGQVIGTAARQLFQEVVPQTFGPPAPVSPVFGPPVLPSFAPAIPSFQQAGRWAFPTPSIKIKEGDTLASIAASFPDTTEANLQDINNLTVLPPRGSFINGPTPALPGRTGGTAQRGRFVQRAAQETQSSFDRAILTRDFGPTGFVPFIETQQRMFDNFNESFNLTGQVDQSLLPNIVSVNTVSQLRTPDGRAFNFETMQSLGFAFNDKGSYVKGTSPSLSGAQLTESQRRATYAKGTTFGKKSGVAWVWKRKKNGKFVRVREDQFYGSTGGPRPVATPDIASGAGVTPVTTLDVRLGSG